jgi:patatin-like phospholipase/acyl hydrolase
MEEKQDDLPSSGRPRPSMEQQPFRILALDGGGIRGAYTAAFLEGLEEQLGRPIAKCFDMVAGTSTGAIIAVALAMDLTAKEILAMYERYGARIFSRRSRHIWRKACDIPVNHVLRRFGLDADSLRRSKYDSIALAEAVREILGDITLEKAKRRLLVPAVRTSLGRPIVFRTAHFEGQDRDRHLSAVDVILATTAAPTYFPPHWVTNNVAQGQYVDGGLWANNPALVAYVEAIRIARDCNRDVDPRFSERQIMVLSLGTGESPSSMRMEEVRSGVLGWAPHLIGLMMSSQSQGTDRMLRYLLPEERYRRINFVLCNEGWELDAVEKLEILVANGRAEARNHFNRIPSGFFAGDAPAFVPYPRPRIAQSES